MPTLRSLGMIASTCFAAMLVTNAAAAAPLQGPLVGFSCYKNDVTGGFLSRVFGGFFFHCGVFYLSNPQAEVMYAPRMEKIQNGLYRCDDVGPAQILSANGSDKFDLSGMNVELTIDNGWASSVNADYKHPAVQLSQVGNHLSSTFYSSPDVMKALPAPFGIDTFLTAAQHTGSNLLQYGGYSMLKGVNCQTFTVMVLMKLGLPQLADIVVDKYINTGGVRFIPPASGAPAGVHTCNAIGNGGELAVFTGE